MGNLHTWETKSLGDLAKLITGKTPPTSVSEYFGDSILWVTPADFKSKEIFETARTLTQKAIDDKKCNVLPADCIVLNCIGDVGKVSILRKQGSSNQQITALLPKDDLEVNFLYYLLLTQNNNLKNLANEAVVPILNNERLKTLKISFPSRSTQKHIAEILDKADALRKKDKQLLQYYDDLAQSLFIDMFGDPVRNENGWETKPIKELGKVTTGNTPKREVSEYYGEFIEWIKTDNISYENMNLSLASECLSEKGLNAGRFVESGSILVTCIAGSIKSIGNVALTDRKVSFNQQINAFTPFELNSVFTYYLFKFCKPLIQQNSTNGMKRIITKGEFEKIKFISPPLHLQKEFEQVINNVGRQLEKAKVQMQESENLFQALLQKALMAV